MAKISTVIITKNEANCLGRTLRAIEWADEIVVVDSGSKDNTTCVAESGGAQVFFREFDNFAAQKNFAVSKASGEWIFSLDADEIVTPELASEIQEVIASDPDECAFNVNRINYMYGRRLEHFSQPDYNIRLFKKDLCRFVQPVHEYVECDGRVGTLDNAFLHYSIANFKEHMKKAELYTMFELDIMKQKCGKNSAEYFIKMFLNPPMRFVQNYFVLKGMFEGWTGFVISFNAAIVEFIKYYKCFKWSVDKNE